MATKLWAALLILFTTFLTSSAQLLWKKGSATLTPDILNILTNHYIMGGILLYVVGGVLLIISFRGGEVSVLYPIIATSYIWVAILSAFILKEEMNLVKSLGILFITIGIASIGLGSKDTVPGVI